MRKVPLIEPATRSGRALRRPSHTFRLKTRPFGIYPFFIAPVLPGETMKNALFQSRVVTNPVNDPIIGWHQEYYFFYVKLRDLAIRDDLTTMLLDENADISATYESGANRAMYFAGGSVNFVKECLYRITDEYFRDETMQGQVLQIEDGIPKASAAIPGWLDSATVETQTFFDAPQELPGGEMGDLAEQDVPSAHDTAYQTWQTMRALRVTDAEFEDWIRSFGVTPPPKARTDDHVPELLRYVRAWSYPSNTIDPATGAPSSAVSWSIQERMDKARFFKEPGFLFGVSCTRPKVYSSAVNGAAVHYMRSAFSWLPPTADHHPWMGLSSEAVDASAGGGAFAGNCVSSNETIWFDLRDLLHRGDQFVNVSSVPNAVMRPFYHVDTDNRRQDMPTNGEIDALFVEATANKVDHDGVVNLAIASRQRDTT